MMTLSRSEAEDLYDRWRSEHDGHAALGEYADAARVFEKLNALDTLLAGSDEVIALNDDLADAILLEV